MLERIEDGEVMLSCRYTGREQRIACASLVLVTMRAPRDELWHTLLERGIENVRRIGDCHVPGALVHAVYSGHRAARELERPADDSFRRERVVL